MCGFRFLSLIGLAKYFRYIETFVMSLTNSRGSRVAGPMSRSRVQSRGRGSNVAAGENDLKTTDMKTI